MFGQVRLRIVAFGAGWTDENLGERKVDNEWVSYGSKIVTQIAVYTYLGISIARMLGLDVDIEFVLGVVGHEAVFTAMGFTFHVLTLVRLEVGHLCEALEARRTPKRRVEKP